ncbi:MAG: hypothetical protein ACJ0OL_05425 [Dehalococcoidia bacterium]
MTSMFNQVPVLTLQARIIGLYRQQDYNIGQDIASPSASNTMIITDKHGTPFMLVFFWSKDGTFGTNEIKKLRDSMQVLKVNSSYVYTDYIIEEKVKTSAEKLDISIVDYPDMEARGIMRVQQMYGPSDGPDKPLPFERYIPWFVGISLIIIIFAALVLVSVGMSFVQVPN